MRAFHREDKRRVVCVVVTALAVSRVWVKKIQVLGPNEGNVNFNVPYQVAGIKPTLGHINHFTEFFDSNLGPDLDSSFLWGSIGILLRVRSKPPPS